MHLISACCKSQILYSIFARSKCNMPIFVNYITSSINHINSDDYMSNLFNLKKRFIHCNTISLFTTKDFIEPHDTAIKDNNGFQESDLENFVYKNTNLGRSKKKVNVFAPPESPDDLDFIKPHSRSSYNIATFADRSEVLRQFLYLGVEIAQWDRDPVLCSKILRLDFQEHVKPLIFTLSEFGVCADQLGSFITKNPYILFEKLQHLHVRINYLESKKLSKEDISKILITAPKWININTVVLDKELGVYQQKFRLTGTEVRQVMSNDPKLILYSIDEDNYFMIETLCIMLEDDFGFSKQQIKNLLLTQPRIFRSNLPALTRRFEVLHSDMGLSLKTIQDFPFLLLTRDRKLTERHSFLKYLGKNQYDPKKPNYVSPTALVSTSDANFAMNVVRVDLDMFNDYLKTL